MKLSLDNKAKAALERAVAALENEAPAYQILADIKRALSDLNVADAPEVSEPVEVLEVPTEPVRKAAPKVSRAKKTTED